MLTNAATRVAHEVAGRLKDAQGRMNEAQEMLTELPMKALGTVLALPHRATAHAPTVIRLAAAGATQLAQVAADLLEKEGGPASVGRQSSGASSDTPVAEPPVSEPATRTRVAQPPVSEPPVSTPVARPPISEPSADTSVPEAEAAASAPSAVARTADDLPVERWDQRSAASLRPSVRTLDATAVQTLLDWEREHANRPQVVTMLRNRMSKIEAERTGGDPDQEGVVDGIDPSGVGTAE